MTASTQKYYYVIVHTKKLSLLLEDSKLPFYWRKKIADERCALFKDFHVEKVNAFELLKFIHTYPL